MHRPTVGIIALVLLIGAVGLLFTSVEEAEVWRSACLRVGLLMAAVWLAHPHLKRLHPKLILFGVLLGVIVLVVALKHPVQIALLMAILLLLGYLRTKTSVPAKDGGRPPRRGSAV
jgi:hypothetical protein